MPDAVGLIMAKRDGGRLAGQEIGWLFDAFARGEVADEQMSALLMAVYFRGLDPAELRSWTAAMVASGERLDLSSVPWPTVDKHSTGGVGDKVSLILAPLVASCGAAVPQLSGRGLGHTGGTLDKLESIPGWRASLPPSEMLAVLREVGCVICAAGPGLAPADRRLYALRDVTGTVESIPLIASSIMSKKIAEGTGALALEGRQWRVHAERDASARARADHGGTRRRAWRAHLGAADQDGHAAWRCRGERGRGRGGGRHAGRPWTGRSGRGDPGAGRRDAAAGRNRGRPGRGAGRRPRARPVPRDGGRAGR
jgi:hypothetical protein